MQQNHFHQFFIIIILVIFSFIFINSLFVKAATVDLASIVVCTKTPCSWGDFINTLHNVVRSIVEMSFYLTVLFSVIGSFMIMFHGPKPEFYKKGKSFIAISITGYIILLFSALIFDTILDILQPSFVSQYLFEIIDMPKILINNYFYFN